MRRSRRKAQRPGFPGGPGLRVLRGGAGSRLRYLARSPWGGPRFPEPAAVRLSNRVKTVPEVAAAQGHGRTNEHEVRAREHVSPTLVMTVVSEQIHMAQAGRRATLGWAPTPGTQQTIRRRLWNECTSSGGEGGGRQPADSSEHCLALLPKARAQALLGKGLKPTGPGRPAEPREGAPPGRAPIWPRSLRSLFFFFPPGLRFT